MHIQYLFGPVNGTDMYDSLTYALSPYRQYPVGSPDPCVSCRYKDDVMKAK